MASLFIAVAYLTYRRVRRYRKLAAALDKENAAFAGHGNRMRWQLTEDGLLGAHLELEVAPGGTQDAPLCERLTDGQAGQCLRECL